jgi:hypothetical protein
MSESLSEKSFIASIIDGINQDKPIKHHLCIINITRNRSLIYCSVDLSRSLEAAGRNDQKTLARFVDQQESFLINWEAIDRPLNNERLIILSEKVMEKTENEHKVLFLPLCCSVLVLKTKVPLIIKTFKKGGVVLLVRIREFVGLIYIDGCSGAVKNRRVVSTKQFPHIFT